MNENFKNKQILCCVCHFYGENNFFNGKSTFQIPQERKQIIEKCISQLKSFENINVKICGIEGFNLVDIDLNFEHIRHNPTLIMYEALNYLANHVEEYDYFICVEDDILVPKETLWNIFKFDQTSLVNEILLPNRLEQDESGTTYYCIDTTAISLWSYQFRRHENREIRVAHNPHSGILVMSKSKLFYALENIDTNYRGVFLGKAMESAFAYFHSAFSLYRAYQDVSFHIVYHMDKWLSDIEISHDSTSDVISKNISPKSANTITLRDFIPSIIYKLVRYLKLKH